MCLVLLSGPLWTLALGIQPQCCEEAQAADTGRTEAPADLLVTSILLWKPLVRTGPQPQAERSTWYHIEQGQGVPTDL